MALANVWVKKNAQISPVYTWQREDRTTSGESVTVKAGDPVMAWRDTPNFARMVITAEPTVTVTNRFLGICSEESDETSSAEGHVNVMFAIPMLTVMTCKATTVANVDTLAELEEFLGDAVTFTVASAVVTINEDEGRQNWVIALNKLCKFGETPYRTIPSQAFAS